MPKFPLKAIFAPALDSGAMVLSNARSINNIRSRNQVRILICFYSIIILEKLKGYFN